MVTAAYTCVSFALRLLPIHVAVVLICLLAGGSFTADERLACKAKSANQMRVVRCKADSPLSAFKLLFHDPSSRQMTERGLAT